MRHKSDKSKLREGRCTGIGSAYVPYIFAEEAKSIGTASRIRDPIEGRDVHLLSTVEKNFYYTLRWDESVKYIREQMLLDKERIDEIHRQMGLPISTFRRTTDFLVDYQDGSQKAFSIKSSIYNFDENLRDYRGNNSYEKLLIRQEIERVYWESQGVSFHIITVEAINCVYAANIEAVMGFYEPTFIINEKQMMMYLIAHKVYEVDLSAKRIDIEELYINAPFDIKKTYEFYRRNA